jgi:ketosteroid isomerase-like protein
MRLLRLSLTGMAILILVLVGGSSVVGQSDASPAPMPSDGVITLTPAAVERAMALERFIREYEASWDAHDLEAFGAFLSDEEFLFVEPGRRIGSKEVFIGFMAPFLTDPEHVGATGRRFHVGDAELIEPYLTWGFGGATEGDPLVQVDLFSVRDEKITSIQALYGADLLRRYLGVDPTDLIRRYEAAWSSGDVGLVDALYADDAVRGESLYRIELRGSEAIARDAAAFLQRHPGVSATLIEPYVFGDAATGGGTLRLADDTGCDIEYTVLLETDEAGLITRERVYYDIAAITRCGWQR